MSLLTGPASRGGSSKHTYIYLDGKSRFTNIYPPNLVRMMDVQVVFGKRRSHTAREKAKDCLYKVEFNLDKKGGEVDLSDFSYI